MTWYWGKWSKYLQEKVAKEEARDPSSVTETNKFYGTTTTTQKEYWSEDQLTQNILKFLKLDNVLRTGNLLDVLVTQRKAYTVDRLKAYIVDLRQKVSKAYPECKWDCSPEGLYIWRK